MIIYNETSSNFLNHIYENKIGYVLKKNVLEKMNKVVSGSELRSWENSLPQMAKVLRDADLKEDTHVLLEYKLPSSEKRIDFLVAGQDEQGTKNAVIIELKQWQKAKVSEGDGIVRTFLGGRERETVHPAYQASSYKRYLQNFNESLYSDSTSIQLHSCAYLHNNIMASIGEPLLDKRYSNYLQESPVYFQFNDRDLARNIRKLISKGHGREIADTIENGKIRPSKKLVETVGSLIEGNEEFVLLDEQKVAYEKVVSKYNQFKAQTDQIVVPKTLIENWEKEILKFAPSLLNSFRIHIGVNRTKNPVVLQRTGITITTYQTLVKDQLVFGQVDWKVLICDEAQAIKNPSTAVSKVIKAMKAGFRLALTGTPVENSLSELWSILDFVQPGLLGSLSQFKKEFVKMESDNSGRDIEELLTARISSVYKRRTKSGELGDQLPPKNIVVREVPMGPIQVELYKEVLTLVKEKMLSGLEAIQKLKSLSSHPALINEKYKNLMTKEVPKLIETLKIIEDVCQKGEKVLIFTEYIQMQQLLRNCIRERFEINPMIINGMTNRRQHLVDIFNEKWI
jgi:hypothetical protein